MSTGGTQAVVAPSRGCQSTPSRPSFSSRPSRSAGLWLRRAEVRGRATWVFAGRGPEAAADVEKEGPRFGVRGGQGGEEGVVRAGADEGGGGTTRVRASTLFFDQALDRFFS